MNNHLIWAIALILIFGMICGTLLYLNSHPYVFEIGPNALEAVKSINWTAINEVGRK